MKKNDIREAIDYAIRSNDQEGLATSAEARALLELVAEGVITFDEIKAAIDIRARALSNGVRISLADAWQKVKDSQ